MRIVCAGGGPAGLYFAIQMKRRDPSHRITVIERNRPDDTFGWGVVFSDETLRNLEGADPPTKQEILDSFAHWDDIDIHFKGRVITSGGHGFCGIERRHLLNILQRRAEDAGRGAGLPARGGRRRRVRRRRPDRGRGRHQQQDPQPLCGAFQADDRGPDRTGSSGSAPIGCSTRSPSSSWKPSSAGSRRTPIASTATPPPSSSRPPTRTGARPGSIGSTPPARSRSASGCSRPGWMDTGCWRT